MSDTGLRGTTWHRDPPAPRVGGESGRRSDSDTDDDDILREARERFQAVLDWEGEFRQSFVDDVRFCNGDSDNHWQWPDGLFNSRDGTDRPSLTVNKTRQHCLQVVNDAKQNKPEVKINPVSDEATKEAADVFEGVVRHIEYISDATTAYDTATEHSVQGGIGWWRIITDWESSRSFDQDIRIQRVRDALSIHMDPDIQQADGSDARYAFVVDDVPRDVFEAKYPEYEDNIPQSGFGFIDGGWLDQDHVRVAEYYRRSEQTDTLHLLPDGSTLRESELEDADSRAQLREMSQKSREITEDRVEWFKIVGGTIVDRKPWPGKYIPLVRVVGEETVIEGRLERKGHTRALKDPQRIYNYWTSSSVESVALQTKTPYLAATESIENFQHIWDSANTENHPVLPFNARDDQGQPLPPPQRQDPPQMAQAYIQGMQIAQNEMMMVSGQYAPQMGQPSPQEISGKAIQERQRQGDNATYHFVDNLATAIRFTGRILIDLIPKIYDTPRVLRILQADGSVDTVQLDPQAPQALQQIPQPQPGTPMAPGMNLMQGPQPGAMPPPPPLPSPQQAIAQAVTRIFNPNVGRYEVQADVGPSYATRRQEQYNAFVQIMTTAPQLMQIAGDLLFKAADFPMSEELSERLLRMVPPQALGQGPPPEVAQMQQQLQGAQAHVALLSEQLAVERLKVRARDEGKDLEGYRAVTERMQALLNAQKTDSPLVAPEELRTMIRDLVLDALTTSGDLSQIAQANMPDIAAGGASGPPGMPPGTGPPGMPGAPPGVHPGVFNGQMTALSPVRSPMIRPPGQAPFRGVTGSNRP